MNAVRAAHPLTAVPPKDRSRYRYSRAVQLAVAQAERGTRPDGLEAEVSKEIERTMPIAYVARGGVFMPLSLASPEEAEAREIEARALQAAQPRLGTELVGGRLQDLVTLLRPRLVAAQLGAIAAFDLDGPSGWPAQTGGVTAQWLGEGATATESDPQYGFRLLNPRPLMIGTTVSRQLLQTASASLEATIRDEFAAASAAAIDRAVFHGSGSSNEPQGIYATNDVATVAFAGTPTLATLATLLGAPGLVNGNAPTTSLATTPGMARRLLQTFENGTGSRAVWTGPTADGLVLGSRAVASNTLRSDLGGGAEHAIVVGDFANVLIGSVGAIEVIADPFQLARQGLVRMTSIQLVDVLLRRPEAFARGTGATIV